jgi:outer membrane protein, adhesin transport system
MGLSTLAHAAGESPAAMPADAVGPSLPAVTTAGSRPPVQQDRRLASRPVARRDPVAKTESANAEGVVIVRDLPKGTSTPAVVENTRGYLENMVRKALALSPDVNAAKANWHAAEYDVEQAKGQRWPQVQLGGNSPSLTFGHGTNDSANNPIGTVSVAMPLFDWGRIGHTIDSRAETSGASYQQFVQAQQKVAFDTVSALTELRRNRVLLAQSDAYVKRMDELVDMLSEIVKSDAGRGSELTQARARRLQALSSRDLVLAKLGEIQVSLAKLVGAPVELPPELQWDMPAFKLSKALSASQGNPSVLQARAEAKAASLYAQSIRDSRWPQLNWVVQKTTQQDAYGNTQPWATGLSLQWNAFSGGSLRAQERAADARAGAGEERANAAARDLEYTLRTSAEQRDMAAARAQQYDDVIRESDKVRKMFYDQWYHLGKRTLLDVLIAESEHYSNQVAQTNSRFDGEASNVRIYADSGTLLRWLSVEPVEPVEPDATR